MQALSFAVHIPLVCFGIAFPAMVLFVEWLYLRTGDPLYRALARRWSKVMLALFAVGVVTGTILSLRDRAAVAELHGDVRRRVRARLRARGLLVLPRGDLHRDLRLRLGPAVAARALRCAGIPIVIAGFTGSLMVIAVNGWMNHPSGFRLVRRRGGRTSTRWTALFGNRYFWHELVHMYLAGYIVAGFLVAARLRVGAAARPLRAATSGRRSSIPLTFAALAAPVQVVVGDWAAREVAEEPAGQAGRVRGARPDDERARRCTSSAGTTTTARCEYGIRDPRAALAARLPRPERDGAGPRHGAAGRPPAGQRRALRVPDDGRHRHRCSRCSASCFLLRARAPAAAARARAWFYRAVAVGRAAVGRRADRRLGRRPRSAASRGSSTSVMRTAQAVTGAERHPGRLRHARRSSTLALGVAVAWLLRRLAARRRAARTRPRWRSHDAADRASILVGLAAYAVLGGADFGAGFWELLAGRGARAATRVREHAHHAMGPVWEANHVWLIFVLVVLWTAYPAAFGSIASTLAVPLFLAAVGIILRGTAYALRGQDGDGREARGSVETVLRALLGPDAVRARRGDRRHRLRARAGRQRRAATWSRAGSTRPRSRSACSPSRQRAYLAAVYLAADAVRRGDADLEQAFRARALGAGRRRRRGRGRGRLVVLRTDAPRALRRADAAARPGRGDRLGAARASRRSRSSDRGRFEPAPLRPPPLAVARRDRRLGARAAPVPAARADDRAGRRGRATRSIAARRRDRRRRR